MALKTILKEIDPVSFDESLKMGAVEKRQYSVKQEEEDRKTLDKKWEKLNAHIKKNQPTYTEPKVPFCSSTLVKDFNDLYSKIYDKEKLI